MINSFIRAIAAGLMIGIAGTIYLAVGPPWGAILFSIGLIIICTRGFNLYTGKVGYAETPKDWLNLIPYIIGNAVGTWLIAITQPLGAKDLVAAKLTLPTGLVLMKAIWCGFLMYIAVDIFKKNKNYIGIICCIPAFILAGFEHSIADIFYIFVSQTYTIEALDFILLVIIGNAIGANFHLIDFE